MKSRLLFESVPRSMVTGDGRGPGWRLRLSGTRAALAALTSGVAAQPARNRLQQRILQNLGEIYLF
jgi:hypothetical protein